MSPCHIIGTNKDINFKFVCTGFSFLLFLFFIGCIYFCTKKIKKFKDIKAVFPQGLINNKDENKKFEEFIANGTMEEAGKTNSTTNNYLLDNIETNKNYKLIASTESNYNIEEKVVKQTKKISNETNEVISVDDSDGKV